MKKKLIGAIALGIFFILSSIRGINYGLHFLLNYKRNFVSYYIIIISITSLILGIGILKLQEWARKGIIYYQIIIVFLGIILTPLLKKEILHLGKDIGVTKKEIVHGLTMIDIAGPIIEILFTLIIIYYLTRPKVKEQFK